MKKKLYFLRHGETDWNLSGKLQGWTDISLNSTGREQAFLSAEKLSALSIECILTSSLKRATQTADIINSFLGVPIIEDSALKELSYGICEGMSKKFISMQYAPLLHDMYDENNPERFNLSLPNGESWNQAETRVLTFLKHVLADSKEENILIVSHGRIITNLFLTQLQTSIQIGNCGCVSCLYDTNQKTFSTPELVLKGFYKEPPISMTSKGEIYNDI
ncbi:MAG: histidine phosphatase family protein [Alphaproteobacteria bacterium]|nr:histidine phosphatase family protein [Alphaproteobacteria bacterium]